LGVVNFLMDYIPFKSLLEGPLNALRGILGKRPGNRVLDGDWTPECQQHFDLLKKVLSNPPVLQTYNPKFPLHVATDSSQYGVGAVLYQVIEDKISYIRFASSSLNSGQRNYSATKRELLAIIFALNRFRPWLYGVHFTLQTDHNALTFMFTQKTLTYMLQSWWEDIAEFSFDPVYVPGIMNVLPDHLSRLYDELRVSERLTDKAFGGIPPKPTVLMSKAVFLSQWRRAPLKLDMIPCKAFREKHVVLDELVSRPNDELCEFIQQRFSKRLPESAERPTLVDAAHIATGHQAAEKMYHHLWHVCSVFWPTMRDECMAVAASCVPCMQFNVSKHGYKPLSSIRVMGPWYHLSIDLGQMPTADDYNYFLVVVCLMTGFVRLVPLKTKHQSAIATALTVIFRLLGWPTVIQSDNGKEFDNQALRDVVHAMGTDHRFVIPYNPRANGQAENAVKQTKTRLHKLLERPNPPAWPDLLPEVEESINVAPHSRTKTSPFVLMFNRGAFPTAQAALEEFVPESLTSMSMDELRRRGQLLRTVVWPLIIEESNRRKLHDNSLVDASRKAKGQLLPPDSFPLQCDVMILDPSRSPLDKHAPKYIQKIFRVVQKTDQDNFLLMDTTTNRMYDRPVHVSHLLKVRDPELDSAFYAIEAVLDYRGVPPEREYLIHWKGYPVAEATWEPSAQFSDDPDWIKNWEERVDANRRLRRRRPRR